MKMADFGITLEELKILSVLNSSHSEMYGHEVKRELEDDFLLGVINDILRQLERRQLVSSRLGAAEIVGVKRRFYLITTQGIDVLREAQKFFLLKWGIKRHFF